MKKTLITLLLLLLLLPQSVQAAEGDESALASVESAAGVGDISTPDTYEKMTDSGKKDLLSASLTVIQDTLTGIFGNVSGTLFLLLATVLLAALLHTARGLANSRVLESAVELLIVLALAGILYTSLKTLFEMTRQAFLNLSVFLTSFLPVTASLYTMTGSTATAAAGTSLMLLFNNAVVALADRFLFPLLQVCFALSLVSAVPNGISLQSIITLVKNTVTTLLAFAFTMLFGSAVLSDGDHCVGGQPGLPQHPLRLRCVHPRHRLRNRRCFAYSQCVNCDSEIDGRLYRRGGIGDPAAATDHHSDPV